MTLVVLPAPQGRLAAYIERLMQGPSVDRVLEEARPHFQFYPYRESLPSPRLARHLHETLERQAGRIEQRL